MLDWLTLEKEFTKFKKEILRYQDLLLKSYGDTATSALQAILSKSISPDSLREIATLRTKLTQKYGSLAGNIHGMAGYVEKTIGGSSIDIFMTAFHTFSSDNFRHFHRAIDESIQCLDKAIGACQRARLDEVERKGNQVCINKGARIPGYREILTILKEAKSHLDIIDRYSDATLIEMAETLPLSVSTRILIMKESYKEKSELRLFFSKYKQHKNNIEIREISKKAFHSRQIIIDEQKVYELTFSIKDVGNSNGVIVLLDEKSRIQSLRQFVLDWNSATPF